MILDTLANSDLYNSVNPRFAAAFGHLKALDLGSLAEGRYDIDGDNVYFMIVDRDLKPASEAALEVHDRYVDIQLMIRGTEGFGWRDRAQCASPRGGMDTAKDILFFDDAPATCPEIGPGQFVIFFPGDAHAPLIGAGRIRKCIVKVLA